MFSFRRKSLFFLDISPYLEPASENPPKKCPEGNILFLLDPGKTARILSEKVTPNLPEKELWVGKSSSKRRRYSSRRGAPLRLAKKKNGTRLRGLTLFWLIVETPMA
ncbi:MAG: hypothetical protein LBJ64_02765 [Deltaproteobacteria bacterium]|jgi:hypothetical protein|nr:hypothetical protein [Deltaproteobacteria bacterium]